MAENTRAHAHICTYPQTHTGVQGVLGVGPKLAENTPAHTQTHTGVQGVLGVDHELAEHTHPAGPTQVSKEFGVLRRSSSSKVSIAMNGKISFGRATTLLLACFGINVGVSKLVFKHLFLDKFDFRSFDNLIFLSPGA